MNIEKNKNDLLQAAKKIVDQKGDCKNVGCTSCPLYCGTPDEIKLKLCKAYLEIIENEK